MTNLRKNLSGVAVPSYIIDVPGKGKIPVPLDFWKGTDFSYCRDFNRSKIEI